MKAARNRTIDLSVEEGRDYLDRCLEIRTDAELSAIRDRTICGDTFAVLPHLPHGIFDLLIADPPYNLSKDYHGSKFRQMKEEQYLEYTESWLKLALPLLKKTASI